MTPLVLSQRHLISHLSCIESFAKLNTDRHRLCPLILNVFNPTSMNDFKFGFSPKGIFSIETPMSSHKGDGFSFPIPWFHLKVGGRSPSFVR